MTKQLTEQAVAAACAAKNLDPDLVTGSRLTETDIFLETAVFGDIRVERSALPASVPVVIEAEAIGPTEIRIGGIPANVILALSRAGYTTLDRLDAASDEDLLAVDGVGQATLQRIRDQLEIPF